MKRLFIVAALLLAPVAHAQTTLTAAQVQTFERLMLTAKAADPAYNRARAAELEGRAQAGPLGAVSASAGLSLGTGSSPAKETNVGGFDQITPAVRLSANVDLPALFASVTGQNQPKLDALAAAREAEARALRVRVLQAYTAYLSARRAVQQAGDGLEVARAQLGQQQARARAGAATGVDVLQAQQRVNAAEGDVYDANLKLAVAKQDLAAQVGLNLVDLDRVLNQ